VNQSYVRKGLTDVQGKSLHEIQVETAYVWAGRACAAALLGRDDDAHEFAHEAIEHAALSGSDVVLRQVREAMAAHGVVV